jgi:hypothetical protein
MPDLDDTFEQWLAEARASGDGAHLSRESQQPGSMTINSKRPRGPPCWDGPHGHARLRAGCLVWSEPA